jgi:hypothetical protein
LIEQRWSVWSAQNEAKATIELDTRAIRPAIWESDHSQCRRGDRGTRRDDLVGPQWRRRADAHSTQSELLWCAKRTHWRMQSSCVIMRLWIVHVAFVCFSCWLWLPWSSLRPLCSCCAAGSVSLHHLPRPFLHRRKRRRYPHLLLLGRLPLIVRPVWHLLYSGWRWGAYWLWA